MAKLRHKYIAGGRFLYPGVFRNLTVVDQFSAIGRMAGALSALAREKIESAASVNRAL